HGQFSRFRGYVFFEADDSSLLPWNTTKNYMDVDSPTFLTVRQKMVQMMKPVISFLNKMKEERENDNPEEERHLEKMMNESKTVSLLDIEQDMENSTATVFQFPTNLVPRKQKPDENKISYFKPKFQVEKVKKRLNATTLKEVGERTFEYFYEMEVGE